MSQRCQFLDVSKVVNPVCNPSTPACSPPTAPNSGGPGNMDLDDLMDDIQAGGPGSQQQDDEGAHLPENGLEQHKPQKPKRVLKKRPKLTLQQLQAPNGLQEVFDKFPKWFQDGYKGKGHEVRDLRRLLELYQRWQPRLFNYYDYNQFEGALEKMSGTNALKVQLQEMRAKLPDLVDPKSSAEQEQQDGDDAQQQQQQQQQHNDRQQPGHNQQQQQQGGFDDLDDDELLQLQAETAWEANMAVLDDLFSDPGAPAAPAAAAASTGPAGAAAAAKEQHSDAGAAASPAASPAAEAPMARAAKRSIRDWSDDDDDDGDDGPAMEPRGTALQQTQKQRHGQRRLQRAPQRSSSSGGLKAPGASEGLEDEDVGTAGTVATTAAQPGRGRLRKRQVLEEDASADEGMAAAAAAAGLEDSESGDEEAGGAAGGRLAAEDSPVSQPVGAGEGSGPGMQLMVGTEFEETARQVVLLDDDDDDD